MINTRPAMVKDTVLEASTYASSLVSQDHSAENMFYFFSKRLDQL